MGDVKYEYKLRSDYLIFTSYGSRDWETLTVLMDVLKGLCAEHGVKNYIHDARNLTGNLQMVESLDFIEDKFPKPEDQVFVKRALIDLVENKDLYEFFENAAVNRGHNIRVFNDIKSAEKWIKG